jgi:hypothetical protein
MSRQGVLGALPILGDAGICQWSGTDTKGRRLANGVQFCALDNGEKCLSRKVVLTE